MCPRIEYEFNTAGVSPDSEALLRVASIPLLSVAKKLDFPEEALNGRARQLA